MVATNFHVSDEWICENRPHSALIPEKFEKSLQHVFADINKEGLQMAAIGCKFLTEYESINRQEKNATESFADFGWSELHIPSFHLPCLDDYFNTAQEIA